MAKGKRNIFQELCDGIADMKADREGKITLRQPTPSVTSDPNSEESG